MAQIAKAAVGAGIAWAIINTDVDYITQLRQHALVPVFSVMSDHEAIGRIQGQQIGAFLGETGCVLYIEGPSVRDVAKLRTKGMLATKPPRVDVKSLKGDWTQNSGYQAMKSWLSLSTSRQLHVGMIAGQNDDMAIGARRALEELSNLTERDAWLRLPNHRMRRSSPLRPGMGSPEAVGSDGDLAATCRRCPSLARFGPHRWFAAA